MKLIRGPVACLTYRQEAGHRSGEEAPACVLGFFYRHYGQCHLTLMP
jgi:hypothetical protein